MAKTPATPTDKTDLTSLKKGTTKSLLGTATIGYEIGIQVETSALYWRITSNTGNGYFSQDWIEYADIEKALTDWPKDLPLTSMAPAMPGIVCSPWTSMGAERMIRWPILDGSFALGSGRQRGAEGFGSKHDIPACREASNLAF